MTVATPSSSFPFAAVLGIGACSPIGYGVKAIQAAMAGGLNNFQEARVIGNDGEPARISRLVEIDEAAPRAKRIVALTRLAVADLLDNIPMELGNDIPVFVGVGTDTPTSDLCAIGKALAEEVLKA